MFLAVRNCLDAWVPWIDVVFSNPDSTSMIKRKHQHLVKLWADRPFINTSVSEFHNPNKLRLRLPSKTVHI